jgi:hypothetical protein
MAIRLKSHAKAQSRKGRDNSQVMTLAVLATNDAAEKADEEDVFAPSRGPIPLRAPSRLCDFA